ncbi:complement C1q-like protein 3 [Mytilus californianus]|uniref:complement C1q-like protein 3 n=1 Tax=Mytilus californianus TaxID=6549 RepID=UPI0022451983|nr:complement C1q-like protein 3 [Mytilus californianus]
MEGILQEQNERIRKLEEVVTSQNIEIDELKSELAIAKKENIDREQQIFGLKKIVLKGVIEQSTGKLDDEIHKKQAHLGKDKRLLEGIQPSPIPVHATAFYAYMNQTLTTQDQNRILIFDTVKTNINDGYSPNTGIFRVHFDGVYGFTFSVREDGSSYGSYEIIKNTEAVGSVIGLVEGTSIQQQVIGTVVISASQGDDIFVRTHSSLQHHGAILSNTHGRSMFAGWFISN